VKPECPHCHQPGRMTANNQHAVCENKDCSMGMWLVKQ
jgi:hypothetical protein